MEWAEWVGKAPGGHILYLSKDKYRIEYKNSKPDEGPNPYSIRDWENCGWTLEEVNICLENK